MIKPETHFYILTKKQYICEEMDNSKEKKKKKKKKLVLITKGCKQGLDIH